VTDLDDFICINEEARTSHVEPLHEGDSDMANATPTNPKAEVTSAIQNAIKDGIVLRGI
jgi:hypothetical protein